MFEKIEIFDKRYSELSQRLYEPSVAADPEQYQKTMKELKSIEDGSELYTNSKELSIFCYCFCLKSIDFSQKVTCYRKACPN